MPIESARSAARWGSRGACLFALAAFVFFCRAWLVRSGGSPLPFLDQWDGEALALYLPWLQGNWHWADLFRAHNEHRIALTRLADLALFAAYGGWNPWAQLLLNAALHAVAAATLVGVFWNDLPSGTRTAFTIGVAILFAATAGWQNALWGFQLQFYFGNLLAVLALAAFSRAAPFSGAWWGGWLAAALALVSSASGILVAGVALAVSGARCFSTSSPFRRTTLLPVALLLAAAVGLAVEVPQHAMLHAKTAGEFLQVFVRCLAWPFIDQPWFAAGLQLPLVWLGVVAWRKRKSLDSAERCAFAFAALSVVQAAAVAYSRGGALPDFRPLSRYQDLFLLGTAAQLFGALTLATRRGLGGRLALLGWSALLAAGLLLLTEKNLTLHLPYKRAQDRAALSAVRSYLDTGDAAAFRHHPAVGWLHPDPAVVQRVLDDPMLRPKLPRELRGTPDEPLARRPAVIAHSRGLALAAALVLLATLALSWIRSGGESAPQP